MMNAIFILYISIAFYASVTCIPECLTENYTCPLDSDSFLTPPKFLPSWEKCRDYCINQTSCSSFTHYNDNGIPFRNMCFLFSERCNDLIPCTGCHSGYECQYCSVSGMSFASSQQNFIKMFTSYNESSCRDACLKETNCSYYSLTGYENKLIQTTCILLSDSAEPIPCENCRTGPKNCDFYAKCKPNEAVVFTNLNDFKVAKHYIVDDNTTVRIETMGCSV